jgi:circadian clock protein KaiC
MKTVTAVRAAKRLPTIERARTGITGFDAITSGGLPRGRTTLLCGGPGCGKTLLGSEFLARGATEFGESGVLLSFEETAAELTANAASLGFDLAALEADGRLSIDHVNLAPADLAETGSYDLEGLFLRLGWAIDQVGAKRVVIDTIEALFVVLPDEALLRSEIRRLFRWLNERGVTAVVTAERGEGKMTRYGLEEYVSDCVIVLDSRVEHQTATRRMRIVKYRGSAHSGDEFPFLITDHGFSVLPLTSVVLGHGGSHKRISTGIPRLDGMLGGKGLYRGSSMLISGSPGAGKTSVAAQFAAAACRRGEQALYIAYEESPAEIVRNMQSIGLGLEDLIDRGLLMLQSERPTGDGLESHLVRLHQLVDESAPKVVVIDPISAFRGPAEDITALLQRLLDFLKGRQVTTLMTSMASSNETLELSGLGISSLIDTWITIRSIEANGERNRVIDVIKARGIGHSNQVREFVMTAKGLDLPDVYSDGNGIAVGSERVARETELKRRNLEEARALEHRRRSAAEERTAIEAQIATLQTKLTHEQALAGELEEAIVAIRAGEAAGRSAMAQSRNVGANKRRLPALDGRR